MAQTLLDSGAVSGITWVEPYPTRLPVWRDLLLKGPGLTPAPPDQLPNQNKLTCLPVPAFPIEPLPGGTLINSVIWQAVKRRLIEQANIEDCIIGVGRPSELAAWALDALPSKKRFFDLMDDFPAFYDGLSEKRMFRSQRKVIDRIECLLTSSTALTELHAASAKSIRKIRILNGYPCRNAHRHTKPNHESRVIGYIGSIASWFDWDLVIAIALALPAVKIHIYGPVFCSIPSLPSNVLIFNKVDQSSAWRLACEFNIGLIPFKISRLTNGVDPIKYYEYRAAGIPVWSSAFGEMKFRGDEPGISLIDIKSRWNTLLASSLDCTDLPTLVECARQFDWNTRFSPLIEWINNAEINSPPT